MIKAITFDKSAKMAVLDLLGKTVDDEGFIVEKSNKKQRVMTPGGEAVALNEFAGVRRGSQVFIKSNIPSLIALTDYINR
jgi:hypothetical protein